MNEYRYDYHTKKMIMRVEVDFSQLFTEREQKVLFLRIHGYTLNEIADMYDVTSERIRQILGKIEEKLGLLSMYKEEPNGKTKNETYVL